MASEIRGFLCSIIVFVVCGVGANRVLAPLTSNRERKSSWAKSSFGLNAEFSRSSDKPFEWAVQAAADMGYKHFEPMIHFGRELMSETW